MRPSRALLPALLLASLAATAAAPEAPRPAEPAGQPGGAAPVQNSLPDLGSSANAMLSKADEYQIGRMIMRSLRAENQVLDDPETADYLSAVGARIGVEAQDGDHKLTFVVGRDNVVNAYAFPGGFIVVNAGLILRSNSESELAGVMAHEVGHVVQRHIARAVQAQSRSSIATIAGMLGAILVGAVTGNADALPGIISIAQGTAMQQQINFTRMEEHEADRVGIGYLAAAGYDPNGMAGFFTTMMRDRGLSGDQIPALLQTHPLDTVRLAEARARVGALARLPRRPDFPTYPYIRERLRVLMSTADTDPRRYYEQMLKTDPREPALRYGAALAELQYGSAPAAVAMMQSLVDEQPQLPLLHIGLAQAEIAAGETRAGLATFERALAVAPRNIPLTVRYAQALLDHGQAQRAHELLLDLFNVVQPTPEQIRLIALAASAAGDTGDAYYYMAELHISGGDLMLATTQLDLALAAPGLTDVQRKRFLARREEIRGYLREQRGDRSSRPPPPG